MRRKKDWKHRLRAGEVTEKMVAGTRRAAEASDSNVKQKVSWMKTRRGGDERKPLRSGLVNLDNKAIY